MTMRRQPTLIGIINGPIDEQHPLSFNYADDKQLIELPPAYIDYKEDQFNARTLNREPRITFHELLAEYGSTFAMILLETKLNVHLIINSNGGNMRAWAKYAKALEQLRHERSTVTTHALNHARALAADIYICAENQTALDDSQFAFDAGDTTPQKADIDWDRIKSFLLSTPASPQKSEMKKRLAALETAGTRQIQASGLELKQSGCFIKTFNSVRAMFDDFCEQTGIPLSNLPPTPINFAFTVAAIEEQIKKEFGISATLKIEPDGNDDLTVRVTSETPDPIVSNANRITAIIDHHFYSRAFTQKPIAN